MYFFPIISENTLYLNTPLYDSRIFILKAHIYEEHRTIHLNKNMSFLHLKCVGMINESNRFHFDKKILKWQEKKKLML